MRFNFLLLSFLFFFQLPQRVAAQTPATGKMVKTVAILPANIRIDTKIYANKLDSAAFLNIRKAEALRNQQLNYYLLAIKNQPFKVNYQNPVQTNQLLELAGITYEELPYLPAAELAKVLGVDLLFTGMQYRAPNSFSPEARAAFNAAMAALLGPLSQGTKSAGNPEVSFLYQLYDSAAQKLWEYRGQFELSSTDHLGENFLATNYTTNFRTYLRKTYPEKQARLKTE